MVKDISQMKAIESALRASVEEKDVLLKEIHHRVKNNLQVISGLLDLQAHHITDQRGREIYKESQNRVITMALIHEELYQARDLARVDFGAYMENLAANLFASYGIGKNRVRLVMEVEKSEMVVDTAIPCGLIVNELISNALKHAFPDGRAGEVSLSFKVTGDRQFRLQVKDDGVGLPEGYMVSRSGSLGMQLISVIVDQLGGEMLVESEDGTSFTITFSEYREADTSML
jgi:two-component sensor histidine kinase